MTAAKRKNEPNLTAKILESLMKEGMKSGIPNFRPGDTVRVHARIVEGNKERIQLFEGVVLKRHKGTGANATFTVRKVSYNIGVERTFLLHSPRIEKIEVVSRGHARRARLFHLRPLRGKAAKIKSRYGAIEEVQETQAAVEPSESSAEPASATNGHAEVEPTQESSAAQAE